MTITNYDPRLWGSGKWAFLELIARSFPDTLSSAQQYHLKQNLLSLEFLLPCEICKNHYSEYIKKTNLRSLDLSKKTTVKKWINDLHNSRLKKIRTMKEVDDYYKHLENKYITSYTDLGIIFVVIFVLLLFLKTQLIRTL